MALAEQEDAILACMFDDGPIGMSLVDVEGLGVVVDGIAPGGLADNQGVPTGAVVHTVAGQSAAGLSKSEIVQIIRSAARPLRMQLHIYASAYPPDDLPSLLQHREPPPLPPPPPPQVQAGDGSSSSRDATALGLTEREQWFKAKTADGKSYYHSSCGQVQWEPPPPSIESGWEVDVEPLRPLERTTVPCRDRVYSSGS